MNSYRMISVSRESGIVVGAAKAGLRRCGPDA